MTCRKCGRQIRHLHNRLDVFADVLEEQSPRVARSLRARDPGRDLPKGRVDWIDPPETDPYLEALAKDIRANPDRYVNGPDRGWTAPTGRILRGMGVVAETPVGYDFDPHAFEDMFDPDDGMFRPYRLREQPRVEAAPRTMSNLIAERLKRLKEARR